MAETPIEVPLDPLSDGPTLGRRNEVPGCPTGLATAPEHGQNNRGPLGVEKLEGRQESGRDEQDEAEEDEPN